jgi:uncharacterized membrane protein YphA (DoxX/SURF4 family)
MNIALWIVQGLLALVFLMGGFMKASKSKDSLKERGRSMDWVDDFSDGQVRLIGILEVLGAIGLILPGLTDILPILTPLAAVGLALTMVGAAITHLRRGEYSIIVMNLVLMALALFIAYGRFVLLPF